jgi:DNA polymerase III subunit gamma/tau
MTYLALARKWRPRKFSEVVGQEHVSQALINALNQQRLHHAYLFTGTRGVGKTSIARIFAKSLNCEQGVSAEPCQQCKHCEAIDHGSFIDLLELDAASKTGVEDMRQLLDNAQYLPSAGRFKVYLIDEVHMLSISSFNALLKTLEEPPQHVKFILATTDPQKVPATVLSRCLQFHLRPVSSVDLQQHLMQILTAEKADYEPEALDMLAHAAAGSIRDGLSLLDQALLLGNQHVTKDVVRAMLGYTRKNYAELLLHTLSKRQAETMLQYCHDINSDGGHFNYVLEKLQSCLHAMMLVQQLEEKSALFEISPELIALADTLSAEQVQLWYQITLKSKEDIPLAPTIAIGFEVMMLRMLAFYPLTVSTKTPAGTTKDVPAVDGRPPASQEARQEAAPIVSIDTPTPEASTPPSTTSDAVSSPAPAQTPAKTSSSPEQWQHIIPQLHLSGLALNAVQNASLQDKNGSTVTLAMSAGHQSLFTPSVQDRVEAALGQYYQEKIRITITVNIESIQTPAELNKKQKEQSLQEAEQDLKNDTVFQSIQETFSAKIVENSIESVQDEL